MTLKFGNGNGTLFLDGIEFEHPNEMQSLSQRRSRSIGSFGINELHMIADLQKLAPPPHAQIDLSF